MASKNDILPLPQSARIEAEAAAWVARLDRDGAGESDHIAFQAWCAMSDLHRQAVDRLSALWSAMDGIGGTSSGEPYQPSHAGKGQDQVPLQA